MDNWFYKEQRVLSLQYERSSKLTINSVWRLK